MTSGVRLLRVFRRKPFRKIRINLVNDLDSLEGLKKVRIRNLEKDQHYSVRADFPGVASQIQSEISVRDIAIFVNTLMYKEADFYFKKGDYFS